MPYFRSRLAGCYEPWEAFTRGPRSSPWKLLAGRLRAARYLFREADLDAEVAWCQDASWDTAIAVEQITAAWVR